MIKSSIFFKKINESSNIERDVYSRQMESNNCGRDKRVNMREVKLKGEAGVMS